MKNILCHRHGWNFFIFITLTSHWYERDHVRDSHSKKKRKKKKKKGSLSYERAIIGVEVAFHYLFLNKAYFNF